MKNLIKLLSLLLTYSAMLCLSSCGGDDDVVDEPEPTLPEDAYEIVGVWKSEFLYANLIYKVTIDVRKDQTLSYVEEHNAYVYSSSGSWSYRIADHTWEIKGSIFGGTYQLVDGKLRSGSKIFTRSGDSSNNADKYAGEDFVGTWQGSDGNDEFVIQFDADGKYTDWLIRDGQRKFEETSEYSVSGNTLTLLGACNLTNTWLNKPFTMTFSGKNQMTLVNSLMSDYKTKLVLTRK